MYLDLQTASNSSKIIRWSPLLSPNCKDNTKYGTEVPLGNFVAPLSHSWLRETRHYLLTEGEGEKNKIYLIPHKAPWQYYDPPPPSPLPLIGS